MNLSPDGYALLKASEGYSASVYKDAAGKDTIGFGHLIKPGESFPHGVTASLAMNMLEADVAAAEAAVNKVIPPGCTQGQFDSLVDFCFQFGAGGLHELLAHGWPNVTAQLPRWIHIRHQGVLVESSGLKTRRAAEVELFNS